MRRFYEKYPIQQTLSVKLSWSHYCELLSISDDQRRSFYEKECERSGWSLRELKRRTYIRSKDDTDSTQSHPFFGNFLVHLKYVTLKTLLIPFAVFGG